MTWVDWSAAVDHGQETVEYHGEVGRKVWSGWVMLETDLYHETLSAPDCILHDCLHLVQTLLERILHDLCPARLLPGELVSDHGDQSQEEGDEC